MSQLIHKMGGDSVVTNTDAVLFSDGTEQFTAYPGTIAASVWLQNSNQNIPSGVSTVVQFDTVEFDPQSMFDGTSKLTVPKAGVYLVTGSIASGGLNVTSGANMITVAVNGTTAYGTQSMLLADSGAAPGGSLSVLLNLNAGDYVQLAYYQNSGGDGVVYQGGQYSGDDAYSSNHLSRLSIALL